MNKVNLNKKTLMFLLLMMALVVVFISLVFHTLTSLSPISSPHKTGVYPSPSGTEVFYDPTITKTKVYRSPSGTEVFYDPTITNQGDVKKLLEEQKNLE